MLRRLLRQVLAATRPQPAGIAVSARARVEADGLRARGAALGASGQLDDAQIALEQALALAPNDAGAHVDLGNVLRLRGDHAGALERYGRALALAPGMRGARLNRASLLQSLGREQDALPDWLAALDPPADAIALRNAAIALDRDGRAGDAIALCRRVLEAEPDHAEAHASLGMLVLKRELEPGEALPHLERAAAADPRDASTATNVAIALQDLGRIDEAIAAYDRAIAVAEDDRNARFHRSLAWLLAGELERAWPDYELRLVTNDRPARDFGVPRWQGEALAARAILVHAEQGLGDEIMFASCFADLISRAGRVIIDCSPKLAPLFGRSFPGATVHAGSQFDGTDWLAAYAPVDFVVPAGSLPLHFRPNRASFPLHRGYLRADPEHVARWRARLDALGPGPKIGLSWRGGAILSRRPLRSLDPLALAPIVSLPGVHFVDLQYDGAPDELAPLHAATGASVHRWQDALDDYDQTAALVSALDLIVSVCTAVIHLGGALGRPVWILAPQVPEWRYGLTGEAMSWYPSVRVTRQPARGAWAPAVEQVAARLRSYVP